MDELELLKQQVDKNTKDIEEIKQVISESWGGLLNQLL